MIGNLKKFYKVISDITEKYKEQNMYQILSLDGGGSWAILQLLTLRDRFPGKSGHEILREFDMVIANSGGSIVLAALAENWSIEKALTLFDERTIREKVFSRSSFWERFFPIDYLRLLIPFGPKYSARRKGEAFRDLFPQIDRRQMNTLPQFIGKAGLKLIVCTYDALNNRAKFFRSYPKKDAPYDSIRLTQAIHGSSNAPIQYFDFPARFKAKESNIYYELWDGALGGFNNPVLAGLIEAVKLGIPKDEIRIVSIGTGNKLMSIDDKKRFYKVKQISMQERKKKWNIFKWGYQFEYFARSALNQAKTILYQPPDWSNYLAMMFLRNGPESDITGQFIRLSPMIHSDLHTADSVKPLLNRLYKMDMDLTKDEEISLLKTCYAHWCNGTIKNQPIEYRITRENELIYINGFQSFKEAMDAWD